eukprot:scaffold6670_cov330-Prasinococcus_capsulatus_cf.AAC.1
MFRPIGRMLKLHRRARVQLRQELGGIRTGQASSTRPTKSQKKAPPEQGKPLKVKVSESAHTGAVKSCAVATNSDVASRRAASFMVTKLFGSSLTPTNKQVPGLRARSG